MQFNCNRNKIYLLIFLYSSLFPFICPSNRNFFPPCSIFPFTLNRGSQHAHTQLSYQSNTYDTNLLIRQTNAQYINNKVCIVKYSYVFRCISITFKDSFLIYTKVTLSVKLKNSIKLIS